MANSAPPPPGAKWVVNAQTPTVSAVGQSVMQGWNIDFTTAAGHQGRVFVPVTQYNPDNVRALVNAQAATLDAVGAMTG